MIKYISFDLDGTLIHENKKFDYILWSVEIPKLYAKKNRVSLKEARKEIFSQYYSSKYIDKLNDKDWTRVTYWLKRFRLEKDLENLVSKMKKHVNISKKTIGVLKRLSKKHDLILITASDPQFIKIKLETDRIEKYFKRIFSIDSLKVQNKDEKMYLKVLKQLKAKPEEIAHVGDGRKVDFEIPSNLGIIAFHLNHKGSKEKNSVKSLVEFEQKLKALKLI